MIDRLTKEILDTAYQGFYADGREASSNRFSPNNIKLLSIAIRKMFDLLGIHPDLDILDKITVIPLSGRDFALASFCEFSDPNFLFTNIEETKETALKIYRQEESIFGKTSEKDDNMELEIIINQYMGPFACSNKQNILINSDTLCPQLGLHLICHEVMHSLASQIAVQALRKNKFGDEAINEFFARLATLIFNSIDNENYKISGYTLWDDANLFPATPQDGSKHSASLGLYGELLATDRYLTGDTWEDPYQSIENAKELAKYYFLGQNYN